MAADSRDNKSVLKSFWMDAYCFTQIHLLFDEREVHNLLLRRSVYILREIEDRFVMSAPMNTLGFPGAYQVREVVTDPSNSRYKINRPAGILAWFLTAKISRIKTIYTMANLRSEMMLWHLPKILSIVSRPIFDIHLAEMLNKIGLGLHDVKEDIHGCPNQTTRLGTMVLISGLGMQSIDRSKDHEIITRSRKSCERNYLSLSYSAQLANFYLVYSKQSWFGDY
ncbi:hypothetical protein EAF00_005421 [Botryotinia globosa]|nr:hypothetical protein EAF00_005421 [Botryotinia globosa]